MPEAPPEPKAFTGLCGLRNQGATCYLNTLLQSLYLITDFRHAIYGWKHDAARHGSADESVLVQLQRLFARMEFGSSGAVSTKDLTQSFGWTALDSFSQQDIQELLRVLLDVIETTAEQDESGAGAKMKKALAIFEGRVSDTIRCADCSNSSAKCDRFLDLELSVQDCHSVGEALDRHFAAEACEGWHCGKCRAKVRFTKQFQLASAPDVLTVHLKRFVFDLATLRRSKLTHAVHSPEHLEVPLGARGAPARYRLFAMALHSGTAHGGHYKTIARPSDASGASWHTFNDSSVTALAGGDVSAMFSTPGAPVWSAAYMLLYVREGSPPSLPAGGRRAAPPAALLGDIREENAAWERRRREYEAKRDLSTLRIYAEDGCGAAPLEVKMHRNSTLDVVLADALERLRLARRGGEHRLRRYLPAARRASETFGGRERLPLGDLGLWPSAALLLEHRRPQDPPFAAHDPKALELRCRLWTPRGAGGGPAPPGAEAARLEERTGVLSRTARVALARGATVADAARAAAAALGAGGAADGDLLLLRAAASGKGVYAVGGPSQGGGSSCASRGLQSGDAVLLEVLEGEAPEGAAGSSAPRSRLVALHLAAEERLSLRFCHPDEPGDYRHRLEAQRSLTLREAKARAAAALGLDAALLHCRRGEGSAQLRDESRTLRSLAFSDSSVLCLARGPPRRPAEAEVALLLAAKDGSVAPLGAATLDGAADVAAARAKVALLPAVAGAWRAAFGGAAGAPAAARIRLRERRGRGVGGALRDGCALRDAVSGAFGDGHALCVQLLAAEEALSPDDAVVRVRALRLEERRLGAAEEVVVSKKATLLRLYEVLCDRHPELCAAPDGAAGAEAAPGAGHLEFAKASAFGPALTLKAALKLEWGDAASRGDLARPVGGRPLALRDGSTIVVRGRRDLAAAREAARRRRALRGAAAGAPAEAEAPAPNAAKAPRTPPRRVRGERGVRIRCAPPSLLPLNPQAVPEPAGVAAAPESPCGAEIAAIGGDGTSSPVTAA